MRVRALPQEFAAAPKRWVALIMNLLRRRPVKEEKLPKCGNPRCNNVHRYPLIDGALCGSCLVAQRKQGA